MVEISLSPDLRMNGRNISCVSLLRMNGRNIFTTTLRKLFLKLNERKHIEK